MNLVHVDLTGSAGMSVRRAFAAANLETINGRNRDNDAIVAEARDFILAADPKSIIVTETQAAGQPPRAAAVMRGLRRTGLKQPALFWSDLPAQKVADVLEAGAHAWVPFSKERERDGNLLKTQNAALINFAHGQFGTLFKFGAFTLDQESGAIDLFGRPLKTGPSSKKVVAELILAQGGVRSYETLFNAMYGLNSEIQLGTVKMHKVRAECDIKKHLGSLNLIPEKFLIKTIQSAGYAIDSEEMNRLSLAYNQGSRSAIRKPNAIQHTRGVGSIIVDLSEMPSTSIEKAFEKMAFRIIYGGGRRDEDIVGEVQGLLAEPHKSIIVAEASDDEKPRAANITKAIRQAGAQQPILLLGNFSPENIAAVFRAGAQAALPITRDASILSQTADSRLVRNQLAAFETVRPEEDSSLIKFHGLTLDKKTETVYLLGKRLDITNSGRKLLAALIMVKGLALSRGALLDALGTRVKPRTIDVHLGRVRKYIKKNILLACELSPDIEIIKTVKDEGYQLDIQALGRLKSEWEVRTAINSQECSQRPSPACSGVTPEIACDSGIN